MDDITYWLALSAVPGIGPTTFRRLTDEFGGPLAAMQASIDELAAIPRINREAAQAIRAAEGEAERIGMELASIDDEGISVLTLHDPRYPENLRVVSDAPPILYVNRGFDEGDTLAVSIVGSREATPEATKVARSLANGFAERGVTIVSGLAIGIDTAAHEGALEVGGRTIGVLGCGIRIIHPRRNRLLAEDMIGNGALCSELMPNARPSAANLMARDRIVSGLSRATVIVQATEGGGSMDTARRAEKQSRLRFAVRWDERGPEYGGNRALLAGDATPLPSQGPWDFDALVETLRNTDVMPPDEKKVKQLRLFG